MGRFTIKEVQLYFQEQGCVLLEDKYTNNKTPMKYVCICGEESITRLAHFRRGHRCYECGNQKCHQATRISQKEVNAFFSERGCILLSKYKNFNTKLKFICKCGKIGSQTLDFFHSKTNKTGALYQPRCKKCGNADRSAEKHPRWNADRQKVKMNVVMGCRCRSLLRHTLEATNQVKSAKSYYLLGYTNKELLERITNHPNWVNAKNGKWHIDHIFPIKAFLDFNIKDLKIINALDNLQPMTDIDNIAKGGRYDAKAFKQWLAEKVGNI